MEFLVPKGLAHPSDYLVLLEK